MPLQHVRTPEEALFDPELEREGVVVDLRHPEHGTLRQVGLVYGLSRTPGAVRRPVPRVGEHNEEVRREVEDWWIDMDFTDDKLAAIERLKAVAQGLAY